MTTSDRTEALATLQRRPPVGAAARDLLGTARHDLANAMGTTVATERYVAAHLAALRTAAAVLAVRTRPAATKRPRNVWAMLPQVAPELTEWAAFFAGGRQQAGRGRGRAVPGGHRRARPTTCCATRRPSSPWSRPPSAWPTSR